MLLTVLATVALLVPAAAQVGVNEASLLKKLSKSDADIQDPKKEAKSSTWITRGKVYFETLQAPVANVATELDAPYFEMYTGKPQSRTEEVWEYPWVTLYFRNGKTYAWEQKTFIYNKSAGNVALEALLKAYELDPKQSSKIKSVLENMVRYYTNDAIVNASLKHFDVAVDSYEMAYKAQTNPAYGTPNPELLYLAGYYATVLGGEGDAEMYARGEGFLTKALESGFSDGEGDIYYLLYHCLYGQRDSDESKVFAAKDALLEGLMKYPKNENVLKCLIHLYTSVEGMGDPAELVEIVENSLAEHPDNIDLLVSRGQLFYNLGDFDESISSFKQVVELKPDWFEGNLNLGKIYTLKGEKLREEMQTRDIKSNSEYEAELEKILEAYKQAVPWFEKALEIEPGHAETVERLKILCFQLRDSGDEYMPKYEKYDAMYKQLNGL